MSVVLVSSSSSVQAHECMPAVHICCKVDQVSVSVVCWELSSDCPFFTPPSLIEMFNMIVSTCKLRVHFTHGEGSDIIFDMSKTKILAGRCMAMDREIACSLLVFLYLCDLLFSFGPLGVFRHPFPFRWPTLDSFWVPLGSSWTTLGRLGFPWRSPWSA